MLSFWIGSGLCSAPLEAAGSLARIRGNGVAGKSQLLGICGEKVDITPSHLDKRCMVQLIIKISLLLLTLLCSGLASSFR